MGLALLLTACAGEAPEDWGESDGIEIMAELRVPARFDVIPTLPDGGGSFARATIHASAGDIEAEAILPVTGGHLEVRALDRGRLVITEVLVDFVEVPIDAETLPPRGLVLSGISVRLATPVVVEPAHAGARVSAIAWLDLVADWSVDLGDGQLHALRSIPIHNVPFSIDLDRDPLGNMRGRLVALSEGEFWSWADLFALSDLTLDLSVTTARQ